MKHGIKLEAKIATKEEAQHISMAITDVLNASYQHRSDEVAIVALNTIKETLSGVIDNTTIANNCFTSNGEHRRRKED